MFRLLRLGLIIQKSVKVHYFPVQWHQWKLFCAKAFEVCWCFSWAGFPVSMYVQYVFIFYVCEHVLCWGNSSLLWAMCFDSEQLVSWKHLSHQLDYFLMVQWYALLWSRELTQRVFCVIEFLCRCWVVIARYHITVGWRARTGEYLTLWMFCRALRLSQSGHDKSIQNYNWTTQGCLSIYTCL